MPNTFDATLKDLIGKRPGDWARFLGFASSEPAHLLPTDLSVVSASADTLIRCGPVVLHVEFQTGPDIHLAERVLLYNALAHRQTRLPVHSVVFLLQPNTGDVVDRVEYSIDPARGGLSFRYEVVRVWERSAEEFLTGPVVLVPLGLIARPPDGRTRAAAMPDLVRRVVDRINADAPGLKKDLIRASFLLGGMRTPEERLLEIYRRVLMVRDEDTVAFKVLEHIGAEKELRRSITELAGDRFGPPTPEQAERLKGIEDLDRLRRLLRRILRVDSWAALLRGR